MFTKVNVAYKMASVLCKTTSKLCVYRERRFHRAIGRWRSGAEESSHTPPTENKNSTRLQGEAANGREMHTRTKLFFFKQPTTSHNLLRYYFVL